MQWFAQLFFCVFVLFAMNFEYIDDISNYFENYFEKIDEFFW